MNPSIDPSHLPLRDIHLPDPVGWWPPAPGWWIIAALVLAGLAYAAVLRYRRRRHRAALQAVARIAAALAAGEEPVHCVQQLSTVLRRFAMTLAGHMPGAPSEAHSAPAFAGATARSAGPALVGVAGLTGARWLEYLDARWNRADFRGIGAALAHAPYAPPARVSREEAETLARLCSDWIRAQRV
jgi:MYXO-CTERM domain-containing protein